MSAKFEPVILLSRATVNAPIYFINRGPEDSEKVFLFGLSVGFISSVSKIIQRVIKPSSTSSLVMEPYTLDGTLEPKTQTHGCSISTRGLASFER